jgi:energy-coupling factor transporter transmembrane protein EcfT
MSDRAWTIFGVLQGIVITLVGGAFALAFVALSIYVIYAGSLDIWQSYSSGQPSWDKIALILIFVWTLLNRRRLNEIERSTEHVRMTILALASYFDFSYGNKLFGLKGLGQLTRHANWRMWHRLTGHRDFADEVLGSSFAQRNGRKVTIIDDLKATHDS